jgi:hypothetical protein
MKRFSGFGFSLTVITALALVQSAFAGPPLVCHPFQIAGAKTLPWGDDSGHWDQPLANYNISHLVDETLALLSPGTPVIARMETIRRAVIYARQSPLIAKELVLKLGARAHGAETQSQSSALAWFDYGYLIETMKQANWIHPAAAGISERANAAMNLDGYPWVTKALAASLGNAEMEFAAALIIIDRVDLKGHHEYARAALAGASSDSLLARNLKTYFVGTRGGTMARVLTSEAKGRD